MHFANIVIYQIYITILSILFLLNINKIDVSQLELFWRYNMSTKQNNHNSNISNANKGTAGTNKTYSQNQGNRGGQMNPQSPSRSEKK